METVADIIREMRGYSHGMPPSYHVTMSWHDFRVLLDRIEKAAKREGCEMRKELVRPGTETPEQRAALREMLRRCDMPTGRSFPAIKCSRPTRPLPRGFLSSILKQVWTW